MIAASCMFPLFAVYYVYSPRFESLAQAFFTEEFRACKDHLRHKTSMISPLQIQKAGIGFCTAVQASTAPKFLTIVLR